MGVLEAEGHDRPAFPLCLLPFLPPSPWIPFFLSFPSEVGRRGQEWLLGQGVRPSSFCPRGADFPSVGWEER